MKHEFTSEELFRFLEWMHYQSAGVVFYDYYNAWIGENEMSDTPDECVGWLLTEWRKSRGGGMKEFDESEVAEHYANEALRDHEMHDEEAMSTKVEPVDCAVIVSERDNHVEVSFRETEAEWLNRLEAAGIDSATLRYVPAVIVPKEEWERLVRFEKQAREFIVAYRDCNSRPVYEWTTERVEELLK